MAGREAGQQPLHVVVVEDERGEDDVGARERGRGGRRGRAQVALGEQRDVDAGARRGRRGGFVRVQVERLEAAYEHDAGARRRERRLWRGGRLRGRGAWPVWKARRVCDVWAWWRGQGFRRARTRERRRREKRHCGWDGVGGDDVVWRWSVIRATVMMQ